MTSLPVKLSVVLTLAASGCSLSAVKPVPPGYDASSRRPPSCDSEARVPNVLDFTLGLGGLSLVGQGLLELQDRPGTGILLAGIGSLVTSIFAYAITTGDDRAADCRAALLDYRYEVDKALARMAPRPVAVERAPRQAHDAAEDEGGEPAEEPAD